MLEEPLYLLVGGDRKVLLVYRGERRTCYPGETLPVRCPTHLFKVRSNGRVVLSCLYWDHRRRDPREACNYHRSLRPGAYKAEFAGCEKLTIQLFEQLTQPAEE